LEAAVGQDVVLITDRAAGKADRKSEPGAMVMADDTDDVVVVGDDADTSVTEQLNAFIDGLKRRYAYTGVSAFVLLALMKRIRLFVWYGLERVDVVGAYAAWASDAIKAETQFEAVGCIIRIDPVTAEKSYSVPEDPREINHWVGCIKAGGSHGDGAHPILDSSAEETVTFAAIFLSVDRIVIETIADGNCGLDVMCLMLGLRREAQVRQSLRIDMGAFLLAHIGNRAMISSMYLLGEVDRHIGLFELEAAGAILLAGEVGHDHTDAESHGDGGEGVARSFSDEECLAVRWKCRLDKASPEAVINVLRALPEWCIEQTTQEYQDRGSLAKPVATSAFILSRDTLVRTKILAAKQFLAHFEAREGGVTPTHLKMLQAGRMPYGWFGEYVRQHPELSRACLTLHNARYVGLLRMYSSAIKTHLSKQGSSAVAEDVDDAEVTYTDRFKYHTPRTGQHNYDTQYAFKRESTRRRASGGGRHRKAPVLREMLMEWYGIIRHSVDTKVMVRFPKLVLLVKAQMLQQEYCAMCLRKSIQPEPVEITMRWVNTVLQEYRISHLQPNRKYKVARWVLAERLEIFWLSVMKLRKFIILHFGYDPVCSNIDQSPFHGNEAGSKACGTLALRGAPVVPLIEDHAATRERWSLNSTTKSSTEEVRRRLPGWEAMFKAEGKQVELRLKEYVFAKGLPFTVTVVTGDSGSYKEEDIIAFLENHLKPWGPGRRWEFIFLDAYGPGKTNNVQRLCWSRGYIEITHGGGASMVAQTNDTDHHLWVRKRFIEIQTDKLIKTTRRQGGGLVTLSREENLDIMIEVMSDVDLHLKACEGYKLTGTTVALDGSEDWMIGREAKDFWKERNMRQLIDAAVADVEARYQAGDLLWNWETVQSLIGQYPRRGQLDKTRPGQDDEATPDPDGVPWEPPELADADDADSAEGERQAEGSEAADSPADFDEPCDEGQSGSDHRGDGDVQEGQAAKSEALAKDVASGEGLSTEQADFMLQHSGRMQALQQAMDILGGLGGALGASLTDTVTAVMNNETKRFHQRMRGDAAVAAELRASLHAEEAEMARLRAEFQEDRKRLLEKKRVQRELNDMRDQLKKARKDLREVDAVVTAKEAVKSYSILALGQGKKKGGGAQFQKARFEVLERVRSVAVLSPEQRNDWDYFKQNWDRVMAESHGENWGGLFAEVIQNVVDELQGGKETALSDFMHRETKRVLADVPALVVPGS